MQQTSALLQGRGFQKEKLGKATPRTQMEVILYMCYNYSKVIKKLIGMKQS